MYNDMLELKTTAKKWGNSVGVLLPKKLGVRPNQPVRLQLELPVRFTRVKDILGTLHIKGDTLQLLKKIDRELDV